MGSLEYQLVLLHITFVRQATLQAKHYHSQQPILIQSPLFVNEWPCAGMVVAGSHARYDASCLFFQFRMSGATLLGTPLNSTPLSKASEQDQNSPLQVWLGSTCIRSPNLAGDSSRQRRKQRSSNSLLRPTTWVRSFVWWAPRFLPTALV